MAKPTILGKLGFFYHDKINTEKWIHDGTDWVSWVAPSTEVASGLETLNEGNGIGWRLIGRAPANYGGIGFGATDLSTSTSVSTTAGATGENSFAVGYKVTASGDQAHAEGSNTLASGFASHAEGDYTEAVGESSHAEGVWTEANGITSHAEGKGTVADGQYSHAEGEDSASQGKASHAEGDTSISVGGYSHAEGFHGYSEGDGSHSEGIWTEAKGKASHAEGDSSVTYADYSHAEGHNTYTQGQSAHSEGEDTAAEGLASHAEGLKTTAQNDRSHAAGQYNVAASADTIHETGVGTSGIDEKNAFEIYLDGTVIAPEMTNSLIDNFATNHAIDHAREPDLENRILITKEYADTNYSGGGVTDHTLLSNIGTNTHGEIDTHISDTLIHFPDVDMDNKKYVRQNRAWIESAAGDISSGLENNGSNAFSFVGRTGIVLGSSAIDMITALDSMYGAIGEKSISIGTSTRSNDLSSIAIGTGAIAKGANSVCIGTTVVSQSPQTVLIGESNNATKGDTTLIGTRSHSDGFGTTGMGVNVIIASDYSTGIGYEIHMANAAPGAIAMGVLPEDKDDTLFVLGNGEHDAEHSYFEIYDDGTAKLADATVAGIAARGDKALITKEYADNSYLSSKEAATIDVTYTELKARHDAGTFIPGQNYQITDFRTLWYIQDDTSVHDSDWGTWVGVPSIVTQYGITLKIEALIVRAISTTELAKVVHSAVNTTHEIEYDPRWAGQGSVDTAFPDAAATTEFRGMITFRKDPYLDISAGFDFLAVQNVRWAADAETWAAGTTYLRGQPVKIVDGTGDGQYISLSDNNTGNAPDAANSEWWLVFRDKGANIHYRDYWMSRKEAPDTDPSWLRKNFYGFTPKATDFKLFYTFAMEHDLTEASGGYGSWVAWYFRSHMLSQNNNVLLIEAGEGRNIFLNKSEVRDCTFNGNLSNIVVSATEARRNYIFGTVFDSALQGSVVNDNYIGGLFETLLNDIVTSNIVTSSASMPNNQASIWASKLTGYENIMKPIGQHKNNDIEMSRNTVLGNFSNNTVKSTYDCTLVGNITGTNLTKWNNVIIPKEKTIKDVLFSIPAFSGKITWDATVVSYDNISVTRRYIDDPATTTVEKLWYEEVDINGTVTYKEVK